MNISLVTLTSEYIAQMAVIEAQAHSHPWNEACLADCFGPLYRVFGLLHEGELQGFAIMQQILDEVTLLDICVIPEGQGQGLGRCLLSHVIEQSKANAAVILMLEVRESNRAARGLYEGLGFIESGRRKGYYDIESGKEDAILMDLTF